MNYELLLEDIKEVSKDKLKEIAFNVERSHWDKIHELQEATTKELCQLSKDRTFFEMLLINFLNDYFIVFIIFVFDWGCGVAQPLSFFFFQLIISQLPVLRH